MQDTHIEASMVKAIPMPACIVNRKGTILEANDLMRKLFEDKTRIKGTSIEPYIGRKIEDILDVPENERIYTNKGVKIYKLYHQKVEGSDELYAIGFGDATAYENIKEKYNNERPCVAKIVIDNYDQLASGKSTQNLSITSAIDKLICEWAEEIEGSISRINNGGYVVWFEQQKLDKLIAYKFEILDKVRNIETGEDFPASLSMGIGVAGMSFTETENDAEQALELAVGRGGDQAVVKRNLKIEYYGGKTQAVERSNKGKSRIVGHVIKQLAEQSDKVFIMGHKHPDMDCFGSAIGIAKLCTLSGVETHIVIDGIDESLKPIYDYVKTNNDYSFIKNRKANTLITEDSLVVVLDTNRNKMVQDPKLLEKCERVAVIDHHRRAEDNIKGTALSYAEVYASSTAEIVAEILQFMVAKKQMEKIEAETLLAGIMIDTNNFAVKTGVRTFEAAAWLRRQGADPAEIKRFLQEDKDVVTLKAQAIAKSKIDGDIAYAEIPTCMRNAQTICAQVADSLMNIKGVKAAFAIGTNTEGITVVSARSLGDVNVQVIMEKLGGGGHLTTAAAQVEMSIKQVKNRIKKIVEEE